MILIFKLIANHITPPPLPSPPLTHTHSDDEEIHHIDIQRDGQGFGFSIRGGAEYNAPLCVLRMAEGGAAERDSRLKVGGALESPIGWCFSAEQW